MITISGEALFRMEMIEKFRREVYKSKNLRPVFAIQDAWRMRKFVKGPHYVKFGNTKVPGDVYTILSDEEIAEKYPELPAQPSDEEMEEFLRVEDEWVMEQILAHYGWNTFLKEMEHTCNIKDKEAFIQAHSPCDGPADGSEQCTFLCPKYPCWSVEAF